MCEGAAAALQPRTCEGTARLPQRLWGGATAVNPKAFLEGGGIHGPEPPGAVMLGLILVSLNLSGGAFSRRSIGSGANLWPGPWNSAGVFRPQQARKNGGWAELSGAQARHIMMRPHLSHTPLAWSGQGGAMHPLAYFEGFIACWPGQVGFVRYVGGALHFFECLSARVCVCALWMSAGGTVRWLHGVDTVFCFREVLISAGRVRESESRSCFLRLA